MKCTRFGTAVVVGCLFIVSLPTIGQSGMMGHGMVDQPEDIRESPKRSPSGMMGMMGEGSMGGHMGLIEPGPMLRMLKSELALSEAQETQLKDIVYQTAMTAITQRAQVRVAELELQQLLDKDPVEMGKVEAKVKEIEGLRTALRVTHIKAHVQAKALLSPEQRQQFERIHDRLPGMRGMMGHGMMGHHMRPGMPGGSMGEAPQSSREGGDMPQTLTQEDTQGNVTAAATLLTPEKPRPDGALAVQVKLDSHTVDLDPYNLQTLAVLRNSQGREVSALRLESPRGSGHHREGVLSFPATDADGKPLLSPEAKAVTLVLHMIGGIPERVFQWPLGAGAPR